MLSNVSLPLFTARKKQVAAPQEEVIHDCIVVDTSSVRRPTRAAAAVEVDPAPHLRAALPQQGDSFVSRSGGNMRTQASLQDPNQLFIKLKQHSPFKTYSALELLLDIDHELPLDIESNNAGLERRKAVRELATKLEKPDRISDQSKRYLQSVGLMDAENGYISQAVKYDVRQMLTVKGKAGYISLMPPKH